MRGRALLGVAVAACLTAAAIPLSGRVQAPQPDWTEIAWPFPRDAWPAGRAFRCAAAACGGSAEVYVRPKIGFCNCATGVGGDAEVDAVSDLDMIGEDFRPTAPGEWLTVAGMPGRTRAYVLVTADGRQHPAAGFALSARCDLIAAASLGPAAGSEASRRAVARLLETGDRPAWIRSKLGKS